MASPCLLRAEITGVHHPAQLLDFKGVAGVWEGDLVSLVSFYFIFALSWHPVQERQELECVPVGRESQRTGELLLSLAAISGAGVSALLDSEGPLIFCFLTSGNVSRVN